MATKKKIAIFSGFYLPFLGGIERYTNKLATEMVKSGYSVTIVTTNHEELPSYEEGAEGVTIYRLPSRSLFKKRYPILDKNSEYYELISKVENERFDYFVCNTRFQLTTFTGAQLARAQKKPLLVIDHGSSHFSVNNRVLDVFGALYEHGLTARLKRYTNRFYGVSRRCGQWLEHFRIRAKGVFYNSVDERAYDMYYSQPYKRQFEKKVVITYAGRILREKGVMMLLESFMKLSKRNQDIALVIAGDGPQLSEYKTKYTHPQIFFEGKLEYEDTMKLMGRTDIFCYPSMYPEGLPTSILEAGLMKSAVIATDRGGTKEVITGPEYGMIIEENQVSLTEALEDLINDPSRVTQLKNNLHTRIKKNFTWTATAAKVSQVLKEIDNEQN